MVTIIITQLLLSTLSLFVMIKLRNGALRWGLSLFLNMGITFIGCISGGIELYLNGVNTVQDPYFIFGIIIIAITAIIGIFSLIVGNFFKKKATSRKIRRRRGKG